MTDNKAYYTTLALDLARKAGAEAARVTLNETLLELSGVLNGRIDKMTHALDRSLQLALFVDGRFGTFSTNFLDESALEQFVYQSVAMVRMLEKDPCRSLPPLERTVREALSGKELGLWDESWQQWTPQRLRTLILRGKSEELTAKLAACEPFFMDVLPLSLEEIFIYELGGENHEIKSILL